MFESKINRGRANGYAPLDSGSKVPLSYLPPIQSTIDTGSFATTSSLQSLIDATGSFLTSLSGAISSSEQVLGGSGIYSSSAQIQGNIYSAGNSFTIQDLVLGAGTTHGKILTDGGKPIQMVPDGSTQTAQFWPNGNVTIQTGGIFTDNGFKLEVSGSTRILGTFTTTDGITGSTNFNTIVNKPTLISGSQQIKDLGFVTGSYTTINEFNSLTQSFNIISGSVVNIQGGFDTGSYQTFTSSVNTSISSLNSYTNSLNNAIQLTGSTVSFLGNIVVYGTQSVINSQNVEISDNILYLSPTASTDNDLGVVGHYNDGTYRHAGIFMDASDGHSWKVFKGLQTETTVTVDTSGTGFTLADFKAGAFTGTSFNGQINSTNGVISGSAQITSLGFVSGSYETTGRGIISSSANLVTTSSFNSYTASISTASLVTSISNLNSATSSYLTSLSGAISSSSQLTSSFDARYTLSGSVVSGTTPAGTISGSSQLTSSFDGRYTQTGSFNTLTASFNSFTASAQSVTTGSNSFNGTQTITGSLIITTGSFVASQILANTASLYLTSGSNLYVQNNGVVEITGSLRVSGSAAFNVTVLSVDGRSGDEGGEINLAIPVTNTTLQNRVAVDIFQNRLRIFEGSADSKGVFIDLSKAPAGNTGELMWKASGIVNAGTFVQLDNIKATVPTSGNRGLALATVSGTISGYISGHYQGISGGSAGITQTISLSTSTSTSMFNWNFGQQGDTAHYILRDDTNNRIYRFIMMIGGGYNSNLITIERLH